MSEPAAATPPPEPPAARDVLLMRIAAELEAGNALLRAVMTGRGSLAELVAHDARLADFQGDFRKFAMTETLADVEAATQPAPEPAAAPRKRRAGAHRDNVQRPLFPRVVRDIGPAGVVVAAFRPLGEVIRHPAQHLAAASVMAGTAATLVIGGGAVVHVATSDPGTGTGSTPNPAASIYSATPIAGPSSLPPFASAVTHPKADPDAATSRPLTLPAPPAVSPVQGPGDQQGGNQPSAPAQVAVAGTLQVTGGTTDLSLGADGLTYSGSVTFTAEGGSVRWGTVSNSPHVAVSTDQGALQGVLQPGDSVTLTVSVDAAAQLLGGTATVHVYPGISVGVTWLALPPLPDPAGSILPTVLPSVLPSL